MTISIKQSGGVAGGTFELGSFDIEQLGARGERVRRILQDANFFGLPARMGGHIGADFLRYEITAREADREHTVTFTDDESPETAPLRELVRLLLSGEE